MEQKYEIDINSMIKLAEEGRVQELCFTAGLQKALIDNLITQIICCSLVGSLRNDSFNGTVNDLFAIMREFDITFALKNPLGEANNKTNL